MKCFFIFFNLILFSALTAEAQFRDTLPRQQWKKEISESLIKKLCEPKTFLTSCYAVSPGRCRQQVESLIKECYPRLPATVNLHTEGILLGSNVGRCVGEKYHLLNIDHYKSNSDCTKTKK